MGSLLKNYSEEKINGRVYTPKNVVLRMLDEIGFTGKNVVQKRILDPACGDGRFLVEIVRRILKYSPKNQIQASLDNIFGWDIDPVAVSRCIENLNKEIKTLGYSIDWKIFVKNSLHEIENLNKPLFPYEYNQFDIIIGNPPYIRI